MIPPTEQFIRLLKDARTVEPTKREAWIAALGVPPEVKARLLRALAEDVTVAGHTTAMGAGLGTGTGLGANMRTGIGTSTGVVPLPKLGKPEGPAPDATIVSRGVTLSDNVDGDSTTYLRRTGGVDPMIGRTFAGVVIEKVLGSGGMGRVYLGTDGPGGPLVALKVLLRTQRDDAMRKRFEREARLLKELAHPCIAKIIRTGVEEDGDIDIPFIVMEYVDGVLSITDYVFRQRFGVRESAELFVQVCDALGFAHSQGYMHRDLKPQNILVNRQGRVKVIDFGVARAVAIDSASVTVRTEAGQIVGTMQYMSPEQFKADPRLVDKRSDVYALAAVLYELVSGIQPHDLRGLPVHEAARIVCHTDAPDVRQCNPRVDAGLATLLIEGLSRDASKRPDDANVFGRRLKGWITTPQPTIAGTIHADHPDKVFDREMGRVSVPKGKRRKAVAPAARNGKVTRGGWGAITVVTALLVGAVLVAFDVIPARQLVAKFREYTGTRTAKAAEAPVLPAPAATKLEQFRVVAAPAGAAIRVNGEPRGVSPAVVLVQVSRGGSVEVEATMEGWQPVRTRWTQGKDAPLVVMNLAPDSEVATLQRALVLDVAKLPKGATLFVSRPTRQALTESVESVLVDFAADGTKWRPTTIEFEAKGGDGQPLELQVGARKALGKVAYEVVPDDARHRLRIRVIESK